jgi:hypothetical protein
MHSTVLTPRMNQSPSRHKCVKKHIGPGALDVTSSSCFSSPGAAIAATRSTSAARSPGRRFLWCLQGLSTDHRLTRSPRAACAGNRVRDHERRSRRFCPTIDPMSDNPDRSRYEIADPQLIHRLRAEGRRTHPLDEPRHAVAHRLYLRRARPVLMMQTQM